MIRLSKEQRELIAQSGLFDANWYLSRHPEVSLTGLSAIEHYCLVGSALGKDPGPQFSAAAYRSAYPDVAKSQIDPLWHYLTRGTAEQRSLPAANSVVKLEQLFTWQKNAPVQLNQLESAGSDNWSTQGNDPFAIYAVGQSAVADCWVLFRISTQCSADLKSKFYWDCGAGFSEQNTLLIDLKANTTTTRLVKFAAPLQHVRFDPTEQHGLELGFQIEFTVLSDQFALQWLVEVLSVELSLSKPEIIDLLFLYAQQKAMSSASLEDRAYHYYLEYVGCGNGRLTYKSWLSQVEPKLVAAPAEVARKIAQFSEQPHISLLLVLTDPTVSYLQALQQRLLTQEYNSWQLCLVLDATVVAEIALLLEQWAGNEPRVKLHQFSERQGEAMFRNTALAMASGDWLFFVEQDDLIATDALFELALAINDHPSVAVIYSDEDNIDPNGNRFNPRFKTRWNPDLFYSQNYLSCFVAFKRDALANTIRFREAFATACMYDFYLQLVSVIEPANILHIPRILYHLRQPLMASSKVVFDQVYTEGALRALTAHFEHKGLEGVTAQAGLLPNTFKLSWPLPTVLPKVSILIPTRDCFELISVAVNSIINKTDYANFEIIILDNGSKERATKQFFASIQQQTDRVKVLSYDYPFNYSAINNFGVAHCDGELIALVNNDIEVINSEWLTEMVSLAIRPDIGCVGAKLYYADKTIQHAGVILGIGGVASHGHKGAQQHSDGYFGRLKLVQNYSAVTAACLVVKRSLYKAVGGLNEVDLTVAYNDVDFCLKVMQQGVRNIWTPYAELTHYESVSRGEDTTPEKIERLWNEREYMLAQWATIIDNDPFYSTFLTKNADDFSLSEGFSKPLNFEANIFYQWQLNKAAMPQKRFACVFVGFDGQSKLHDYVVFYLAELAKHFDIHFVTTAEKLHEDQAAIATLQQYCCSITVRKNEGYDFGSWRYGIVNNYADLCRYEGVLLANDSLYGPLFDLANFIKFAQASSADVLGLTDSNEIAYHLQSFFLFFKPHVFTSEIFVNFWQNVAIQGDKWDIIKKYEIGFSQRLLRAGKYTLQAYCDMTGYPNLNHTHVHWRDLIRLKQFPFLKIELVKKNPFSIDVSDMEEIVNTLSDYDYSLITRHG